ncbi:cytoglobin-1-like [Haemaphysalis longicornis]
MGNSLKKSATSQDPGLTERDKKLIRNIWDAFRNEHQDFGVILFSALFVSHPELQQFFPAFRDKPVGSLNGDAQFRKHAGAVGTQISNLIEALDNETLFAELLHSNSAFHAGKKGVKPEHFAAMGSVLISVLSANHERLMTPVAIKAWEKLFAIIAESVKAAFEDKASKARSDSYKLATMSVADVAANRRKSSASIGGKARGSADKGKPGGTGAAPPKAKDDKKQEESGTSAGNKLSRMSRSKSTVSIKKPGK